MEQRIGFGMRLGALLLDCILVFVLSWLGAGTIGGMFGGTAASMAASSMAAADTTAVNAAVVGGILGAVIGMFIAFAVIGTLYFLIEGFTAVRSLTGVSQYQRDMSIATSSACALCIVGGFRGILRKISAGRSPMLTPSSSVGVQTRVLTVPARNLFSILMRSSLLSCPLCSTGYSRSGGVRYTST